MQEVVVFYVRSDSFLANMCEVSVACALPECLMNCWCSVADEDLQSVSRNHLLPCIPAFSLAVSCSRVRPPCRGDLVALVPLWAACPWPRRVLTCVH